MLENLCAPASSDKHWVIKTQTYSTLLINYWTLHDTKTRNQTVLNENITAWMVIIVWYCLWTVETSNIFMIKCHISVFMSVLQKKEWLCLTCQTQRLMSGGGLEDPPLPAPHPSPKHQAMGSPRHQGPASQHSPLNKPSSQQGQKPAQSQVQKPPTATDGSGPFAPPAAKQEADTKTRTLTTAPGPMPTTETLRQPKPTEEKLRTEPENQTAKESKPTQKKGEQIIPIKDLKKSRHYDVSQIPFLKSTMYRGECKVHADQVLLFLQFSIKLDYIALVKHHMHLLNYRISISI